MRNLRRWSGFGSGAALAALTGLLACTGQMQGSVEGQGEEGPELFVFEPVTPRVYVSKVKNLLVGTAATEDEILAVEANPNALRPLVEGWFVTDEAQQKFFTFFQKAFQQTQIVAADYAPQGGLPGSDGAGNIQRLLLGNLEESFARTAKKLVQQGDPFSKTITTHTFMMTPGMMAFYLAIDQFSPDTTFPGGSNTFQAYATFYGDVGLTMSQLYLNALNPNCQWPGGKDAHGDSATGKTCYLHFPIPRNFTCNVPIQTPDGFVVRDTAGAVTYEARTFNETALGARDVNGTLSALLGRIAGFPKSSKPEICALNYPLPADAELVNPADPKYTDNAALYARDLKAVKDTYAVTQPFAITYDPTGAAISAATEWTQGWRMVTIRPPQAGEQLTPFWDLAALRTATELVVRSPRIGFFTTPAFFANWPTNNSNQSRNVTNQALIVALGKSINPIDKGLGAVLDDGNDSNHSDPFSPCYSCHQVLDPMREGFRKFYDYTYHRQQDLSFKLASFDFILDGTSRKGLHTFEELAETLVTHPLYAQAWVQKLCYFAASAPCSPNDPEFLRIAAVFKDSNYSFQKLVGELYSSPLITGATKTQTLQERREVVSILRQDHLCAALTQRLKLATNLCANAAVATPTIRANIPSDGYLRGAEAPLLSTDPSVFYRSAAEALCQAAAGLVVDVKINNDTSKSFYQSAKKDEAISDLVGRIMGISSGDAAAPQLVQLLQEHYAAALVKKASATDALKSTFVTACLSPSSLGMGM